MPYFRGVSEGNPTSPVAASIRCSVVLAYARLVTSVEVCPRSSDVSARSFPDASNQIRTVRIPLNGRRTDGTEDRVRPEEDAREKDRSSLVGTLSSASTVSKFTPSRRSSSFDFFVFFVYSTAWQAGQMIAAAKRVMRNEQVRKVRASQGRMPVNGRRRRLPGQCNRNIPPTRKRIARIADSVSVRVEGQCKRLPPAR